jgi:hypothetical protein
MQTLLAHSAFWRGVSRFAGMLLGKAIRGASTEPTTNQGDELVSWFSGARSRREDELARQARMPLS